MRYMWGYNLWLGIDNEVTEVFLAAVKLAWEN
eukprot:COSAG02_NODE_33968_length_491_cov_1.168367_2_plen_31_part_01